jgi:hypothetical protein
MADMFADEDSARFFPNSTDAATLNHASYGLFTRPRPCLSLQPS